jgi:hypothetical protein
MLITSTDCNKIAKDVSNHVEGNAALIFVAEETVLDINELINTLNENNITFIGGVFPKVIYGSEVYEKGIVVSTIINLESLQVVEHISKKSFDIPIFNFQKGQKYSLLTLVDGLTDNISYYLEKLYEVYGMQTNYFGGGAGSTSLQQKECVFCNSGFYKDAAIYAILSIESNIGVNHGWEKISGPFVVTKAKGKTIYEINWKKPFDIYRPVVEAHSGKTFNDENFIEISNGYAFGILKDDSKYIVRDPLKVNENGEIICIGELENNMLVDILYGKKESLIEAAKKASSEGVSVSINPRNALIIDCISRILLLGDNFEKELLAVKNAIHDKHPDLIIKGALTMGEISSYGDGFLEFYNKTIVVGLFENDN